MDLTDPNSRNLLVETLQALQAYGRREEDIVWAGSPSSRVSWEEFRELIRNVNYEIADHRQYVLAPFLVVAGTGWWLEREGLGLDERWTCRISPARPESVGMGQDDLFSLWYRSGGYARDRVGLGAARNLPKKGSLPCPEPSGSAGGAALSKELPKGPGRTAPKPSSRAAAKASPRKAGGGTAGGTAAGAAKDPASPAAKGTGKPAGRASAKQAVKPSARKTGSGAR